MDWLLDWVKWCVMLYLAGNITLQFRHIFSVWYNLDMQFSKLRKPVILPHPQPHEAHFYLHLED